jgi:hypothetical protein
VRQGRGSQDEERRRDVAHLERRRGDEQRAEPALHHGPDLQPDGLSLASLAAWQMADRVDDRDRGQEAGDDREQDRRPDGEQGDQRQRE